MAFKDTPAGQAFIGSGMSRETDTKIMEALAFFARDQWEAEEFWNGDFRGRVTLLDIWEHVTGNGLHDATEFCWGMAGSRWFESETA